MNEFYRILGESGLGIALREDFARELRQRDLSFDDFTYLKTNSANIASGGHIDFIRASLLLYSVGFDDISSCSLIMAPSQRDFFCRDDYVTREMPIPLNTKDNEVVIGRNKMSLEKFEKHYGERLKKFYGKEIIYEIGNNSNQPREELFVGDDRNKIKINPSVSYDNDRIALQRKRFGVDDYFFSHKGNRIAEKGLEII